MGMYKSNKIGTVLVIVVELWDHGTHYSSLPFISYIKRLNHLMENLFGLTHRSGYCQKPESNKCR